MSEARLAASSAALASDTHANRCCPRALAVLGPSVRLGRDKTSGRVHLRVRELSPAPISWAVRLTLASETGTDFAIVPIARLPSVFGGAAGLVTRNLIFSGALDRGEGQLRRTWFAPPEGAITVGRARLFRLGPEDSALADQDELAIGSRALWSASCR